MPETFNRGTAFGHGFASVMNPISNSQNAASNRMNAESMQERNQMEQQKIFREQTDESIKGALAELDKATKYNSARAFSSLEPGGKQKAAEVQARVAQDLWKSTKQVMEFSGLYTPSEIAHRESLFVMGSRLRDPAAEAKREGQVEAETEGAKAKAKLPSQIALARVRGEEARATRATPTAQTITNLTPSDQLAGDIVTARQTKKEHDRVVRQLGKVQVAFDSFRAAPGSGGLTGAAAETIGGLLGQLPLAGEGLETALNLMLTGGTTEENTRARTDAITLAGDMLAEITGEESGRFTTQEQELARRALRQLSPTASIPQIATAFKTFIETSVNEKIKTTQKMGLPSKFARGEDGLLTSDGQIDYVIHLENRGFTRPEAIAVLKRKIRADKLESMEPRQ